MISAERRKADILKNISLNPIEIKIKQVIKIEREGYFDEEEKETTLTVKIYHQKHPEMITSSNTIGTAYTTRRYGMLVDHTATLEVDSRNAIEFTCLYGRMKITAVYPQIIKGELCGYQCDLERID
ncbi:hypothetical protein [Clostridium tetani]|uniref:DUF1934 domain-containing protein n=1 Tax=Clostridium tetani TaxID=1513 RepID=A0ABC8EBY4_CLOTA|nr:hypothetical protein [Clostridium tetani]BDR81025.1 hypothetical protein K234311028_12710 [Clostridium tetani]